MSVTIKDVLPGTLAFRHGIKPGSTLLKINGNDISDVLDYRFYMVDDCLKLTHRGADGKFYVSKIEKTDEYEDLGLCFDTYLMDEQKPCKNKCIFCFVDQLPKGMRKSLYFKDDDSRMSFFYGNYITLTNLAQEDIDRIIKMHISPVNVSVHTMNPELRVKMMNNKFAGKSLDYLRQLTDAGISINTQLVLCPGINDGSELEFSIEKLAQLRPSVASVACVPVGLTDHRDGLYKLKMYTKATATSIIKTVDAYGDEYKEKTGSRFCFVADEFYLKAGLPIPDEDYYEGYPQLDNGVGLLRLFMSETDDALKDLKQKLKPRDENGAKDTAMKVVSIATGVAAYDFMLDVAKKIEAACGGDLKINVYKIKNNFFGKNITVVGLLTGQDLKAQLTGCDLGETLYVSKSMLRTTYPQDESGDNVFLDDVTIEELSNDLGVEIRPISNDGYDFIKTITEVR